MVGMPPGMGCTRSHQEVVCSETALDILPIYPNIRMDGFIVGAEVVFRAMADTTRRRILQLVAGQELSVSELVACLGQPQSTVSRHLKVLRSAGLIHDRREGTAVLYAAPDANGAANGDAQPLQAQVFEWLAHEELPRALRQRLSRVLVERQNQSHAFFSSVSHRWDQMRIDAFGESFHLEGLSALLPREWVVAEIGVGTGMMLPVLASAFRKVIAVDPVPEMLEAARARCEVRKIKNVLFRQGDLSRVPISNERVDLACAVLVLHHVPSPAEALAEMGRIVKPGGQLLIVEQKAHRLAAFHERMQDRWWGFEPGKLARDVVSAGFESARYRDLASDPPRGRTVEAPELFIMTAQRKTRSMNTKTKRGTGR